MSVGCTNLEHLDTSNLASPFLSLEITEYKSYPVGRKQTFSDIQYRTLKVVLRSSLLCNRIDFGNTSFAGSPLFHKLIKRLQNTPKINEIVINTLLITQEQLGDLRKMVSCNERKGFTVIDVHGVQLDYQLNPSGYVKAKSGEIDFIRQMRKTTRSALETYRNQYGKNPDIVIDFGAGTGDCTIPLILKGCPKIYAVDGHKESLQILKSRLQCAVDRHFPRLETYGTVECVSVPFIKASLPSADILISSFTLPYRHPSAFDDIWSKSRSCIRSGGLIAGHLFAQPRFPKPEEMTYHTLEEVRELLVSSNLQIILLEEQDSDFTIYNGNHDGTPIRDDDPDIREWGSLIHFVAQKLS